MILSYTCIKIISSRFLILISKYLTSIEFFRFWNHYFEKMRILKIFLIFFLTVTALSIVQSKAKRFRLEKILKELEEKELYYLNEIYKDFGVDESIKEDVLDQIKRLTKCPDQMRRFCMSVARTFLYGTKQDKLDALQMIDVLGVWILQNNTQIFTFKWIFY